MENKVIPIFYACDDNFVKYTVVSLASLLKNSDPEREYHVHVLHTVISPEMQERLLELSGERVKIFFDNVEKRLDEFGNKLPTRHYYTKTTYFRFFIADFCFNFFTVFIAFNV